MRTCLLTGFPGFLGSALAERLLARTTDETLICLVQAHYLDRARARARELEAARPGTSGRLRLVEGDITRPDLGLGSERTELLRSLRTVYHLAAAYDLGVARDVAQRVNVQGTRHVLDLCASAPHLERLHYVSTCYVSGRHAGPFGESDLDVGQRFSNHYEETKFRAEVAVQHARGDGLPVTIYRPSIVVGDSRTGATQKLDGPYAILTWILRWDRRALVPVPGDPRRHRVNIVPRDWVVDALDRLSGRADTRGGVYHLCDPDAPTVGEVLDLFARVAGRDIVRLPVPRAVLQALLRVPGVAAWSGLAPEAVPYFAHPTRYTAARTVPLLDDLPVPRLAAYADRLVAFAAAHPHLARGGLT